jgi:hypothetical protein
MFGATALYTHSPIHHSHSLTHSLTHSLMHVYSDFLACLALLPAALLQLEATQRLSTRVHVMQDLLALTLPLTAALTLLSHRVTLLLTLTIAVVTLLVLYEYLTQYKENNSTTALTHSLAMTTPCSTCSDTPPTSTTTTHTHTHTLTHTPPNSSSSPLKLKVKSAFITPPTTTTHTLTHTLTHTPLKLPFITLFRGGNLLMTCLSILAVDFHVYPRRFGKTELYGFSLMDTGAGECIL